MKSLGEITGTVAIEMHNNSYVHALDTGLFTVGAPHKGADRDNKTFYNTYAFFLAMPYFLGQNCECGGAANIFLDSVVA